MGQKKGSGAEAVGQRNVDNNVENCKACKERGPETKCWEQEGLDCLFNFVRVESRLESVDGVALRWGSEGKMGTRKEWTGFR